MRLRDDAYGVVDALRIPGLRMSVAVLSYRETPLQRHAEHARVWREIEAPQDSPSPCPSGPVATVAAPPVSTPASSAVSLSVSPPKPLRWVEPQENLWLLSLKNFGLTLATFGVYHFWGRAEAKRQLVSAIHVDNEPLDYTGTGREAFVSFVVGAITAALIVAAFVAVFMQATGGRGGATVEGIRQFRWQRLAISLPLLFFMGSAVYRRRRHVLRRIWLSGQRFDLSGQAWGYAFHHFWSAFLVPLTLGWAAPWRASMLESRKVNSTHYRDAYLRSRPRFGGLYKAFAALWFGGGAIYVGTLVVLSLFIGQELMASINGLTLAPLLDARIIDIGLKVIAVGFAPLSLLAIAYRKAWLEHLVSSWSTATGGLKLKLPLWRFLVLSLSNTALKFVSFGAFGPVAEARYLRFVIAHVSVDGRLDFAGRAATGTR